MDLILRNARVRGHDQNIDIGINDGLIAKIAPRITARPPTGTISVERMRNIVVLPCRWGQAIQKAPLGGRQRKRRSTQRGHRSGAQDRARQ